ncbi:MAG: hypothetical protein NTU43_09085 [Bacteroidetes bacterium]|nr:hypothetical protein [Bacteroidota bacterium]
MNKGVSSLMCVVILAACGSQDSYYNYDLPEKGKKVIDYKMSDTLKVYEGMSLKEMSYHADVDTSTNAKHILFEKSTKHFFSSLSTKDIFKIVINGEHYYNASIDFSIKTAGAEEIFHDNYPCMQILDEAFDGGGNYATDMQQQNFIKKYVFDFFQNNNFRIPAIDQEREFSEDFSSKADWEDIKSDSNSVGFAYSRQPQSKTEIAFSKKKNATVKYYQY